MKVLYLCHRIPYPPDKGEKIRAFRELLAVAARHEVDLFTLADRPVDPGHLALLKAHCRTVTVARIYPRLARLLSLPYLLTGAPLTIPYFHSARLAAKVRAAVRGRSYDRIFVYCSAMAQYVEYASGIPTLTDLVDVDSDKWRQYSEVTRFPLSFIYRREGRKLRDYERRICKQSARVFVTTEREAELVRGLSRDIRVEVVSMGVDTDQFSPVRRYANPDHPAIIFVGAMSYFPNQDATNFFARRVLPIVRESVPGARFLIVGQHPTRAVRELGKLPGVTVTGYVPDVRPYLAEAQVSVATFSMAAGIQTKLLEAMACGLPVVATPRTVQGLTKDVADVVETGETASELAAKVVKLLQDPELARARGCEGRRRVAAAYDWNKVLGELVDFVEHPSLERTCR